MNEMKAIDLAKSIGISRSTMSKWCKNSQIPARKVKRVWWVRLDRLAETTGIHIVDMLMIPHKRWMKSTDLAKLTGFSRKTINNWCRTRPKLAMRLKTAWYVDLDALGNDNSDIETRLLATLSQLEPS